MDPEVQRLKKSKGPIEIQVAEVSAVNIIQQMAQQLTPFVVAISQVEAGLQCQQAGSPRDEVVGVMVDPGFPPFKLAVGNKLPLLTQVEDATTRIVSYTPQLPGTDKTAPAEANQSAATLIHLIQKAQDMQLALHRKTIKRKIVLGSFPPAVHRDKGSFLW